MPQPFQLLRKATKLDSKRGRSKSSTPGKYSTQPKFTHFSQILPSLPPTPTNNPKPTKPDPETPLPEPTKTNEKIRVDIDTPTPFNTTPEPSYSPPTKIQVSVSPTFLEPPEIKPQIYQQIPSPKNTVPSIPKSPPGYMNEEMNPHTPPLYTPPEPINYYTLPANSRDIQKENLNQNTAFNREEWIERILSYVLGIVVLIFSLIWLTEL